MKKCTKCNQEKEFTEFTKDSSKKDGFYSSCKECNKYYIKKYREQNKEKVALSKKRAVEKNKEKYQKYKAEWFQNNSNRQLNRPLYS